MKKLNKKGFTVQDLVPLAIAFVVIAIVLGMGATILSDIQAGQTTDKTAYNASGHGLESLEELSSWLPTIAIIVVAAIIIGIIILYFRFQ